MPSRITSNVLTSNYLRNMKRNLTNMKTLQNQLASGKEINKISDNPFKASRSMQLHTEISYNKQYNENIKDVSNWLDTTDTALSQMGNVFGRIETLLVSAGNASYEKDERTAIQDEIKEKVNELSQIFNTSFDGSYIFGGTKTDSKPTTVVNGVLEYADRSGSGVAITAYKDSTGKIINETGAPTNTLVTPTPTLTDADKKTLIDERNLSTTSVERKEDITKVLQENAKTPPGILYQDTSVVPSKYTSEPYTGKTTINLNATDITNLQNELKGLDYTDSTNTGRINEINSLLYNTNTATGGLALSDIESYQQKVKLGTATKPEIDALNKSSKVTQVNQINSELKADISQGVLNTYNKTAVEVMEFTDKNGKMIDVSKLLTNIIADLGQNGNINNLTTVHLKDIQSVTANLLKQRSEVGTYQNRMEAAQTNNETQNYNMTDILSKTEDIDLAEKTMDYSMMQTVYTAALQTSAKILPMTILTYLN
ncbi:flagellar hook-associated protein FlgL [Clostridium saccharobutylicum]|uniref:Flagellar hook-associated protein 3 n=1 Tax=Clostridium saccharobutylicum DSM 13864 TaxID=1345695 RepID=U5MZ65_CLOSA|nr:flagellar hook-associated protein FlgL [Clostridium saccharobutylicum]AGX44931.1 flagellar hook-associated protein 3 [Clostridium saccharobutylicum DSM 13864]AQR92213.1 flagellar hook-associated protein 3 [Clostridium saccharobutylicum]AQS02115.1 flagellar hook-associated protein 3 [Clostridium saccharobutylicum]AQS11719.1 flagellar hook-associated protein 3 [Clostridium saccharobutylicum]AQS16098.1 flagellar hook-associated protein 3 [Clostridium saccharobutylicum]